jgi:hypothetical protein
MRWLLYHQPGLNPPFLAVQHPPNLSVPGHGSGAADGHELWDVCAATGAECWVNGIGYGTHGVMG